jgi:hypothetical protein
MAGEAEEFVPSSYGCCGVGHNKLEHKSGCLVIAPSTKKHAASRRHVNAFP